MNAKLADSYRPPAGGYDELVDENRALRPQFRQLFDQLDALGVPELARRWEKARQLLHDNGVSYNVYGDPQGMERPWNLSLIPAVLSPDEWQTLEQGLAQRARLLDALLRDLYGPQRVLIEGLLPPELVYESPAFLRPCHGMAVPLGMFLPLYAADLVRFPSGAFAVLEDRTQAPSGAGYALENRIVISNVLPEAFRNCGVERLAPFFRTLRDTLQALAPHNRDNPRIVLLTPGPYNATYFEQAFLAQYLGYTLVNGGDLTVRADRVYLKTLGGLQPVDVILRRVNDDYSDPLELRSETLLGVPGLTEAARSGNVAIANPLGSGLLQSHAMLPYLGRLARALLGEELKLGSVRSFWCGEPQAFEEARSCFDDAVVKAAFPLGFVEPTFTAALDASGRARLLEEIARHPRRYVIQEHVRGSTTPALSDGALIPRALVTRFFAVAGPSGYVAMPGGLSRVASAQQGTEFSMQLGAGSKDTWVLSRGTVTGFSLLPPSNRPVELSRGGADLPSRAADDLFWLGRYAERAEAVARLARVVCGRLAEVASDDELARSTELVPLLRALYAQTALVYTAPLAIDIELRVAELEQSVLTALFDESGTGTLKVVLRSTLRTGRLVRDRISTDTWRVLAALDHELQAAEDAGGGERFGQLKDMLDRLVLRLVAFSGLVMDGMSRGQAWRFLEMGRRIERAMAQVSLLRACACQPCDREGPLLEAMLDVADSAMTYRRRYLTMLQLAPVVDLLLTDETNPRSVVHQVDELNRHIEALPRTERGLRTHEQRIVLALLTELKLTEVMAVCAPNAHGEREELEALLIDLATRIPALSDSLSARYLTHARVSRHLTGEGAYEVPPAARRGKP